MASKKVEMYAKKRYELDEIKNKIKEEFDKRKFSDVEFKDEIIRELGDTKTLLLIFENWFLRTGSYASLVIRFLYKGIIIKHNKTEPTYTKTSLFLCEKRRFFMARTEKGVVTTI